MLSVFVYAKYLLRCVIGNFFLRRYRYQFMRTMSNENSFLVTSVNEVFVFESDAVSLLKRISERNYLYLFY